MAEQQIFRVPGHSLDGVALGGLDEITLRERVIVVGKSFVHSGRDFLCNISALRHCA